MDQEFLIPVSKTLDMDQIFLIFAYKPLDISKVLQTRIRNFFLSVSKASQYCEALNMDQECLYCEALDTDKKFLILVSVKNFELSFYTFSVLHSIIFNELPKNYKSRNFSYLELFCR